MAVSQSRARGVQRPAARCALDHVHPRIWWAMAARWPRPGSPTHEYRTASSLSHNAMQIWSGVSRFPGRGALDLVVREEPSPVVIPMPADDLRSLARQPVTSGERALIPQRTAIPLRFIIPGAPAPSRFQPVHLVPPPPGTERDAPSPPIVHVACHPNRAPPPHPISAPWRPPGTSPWCSMPGAPP